MLVSTTSDQEPFTFGDVVVAGPRSFERYLSLARADKRVHGLQVMGS